MIRVLVVDDDFMVSRVHRGFVERVPGFVTVGEAHTGTEALRKIEELAPDLVLLDIYLPDIHGLEVLRRLRQRPAGSTSSTGSTSSVGSAGSTGVDVFALTAARGVDTVRDAMRGGVAHYLIKPFGFEQLRDRLQRYARDRRRLGSADELGQEDVDRIFGGTDGRSRPLPKGLTRTTADLVERALRNADGDLSASACAEVVGISRVSARRYLTYFADSGRATVALRYGVAGRPEHRYRWLEP